ncbi:hypothetical protein [Bosea sp. RAC05]|uniref:hypothetical protein n=1 Tax=Bosea sp. RAC05 TaxID=1842539 RepID=UPI00083CC90C|nr:hypothetical protein [Bosea sp. RAC05]AOG03032.1 hypothetical protein BSY19_5233 [Bosea sp. RAC05]
MSARREFNHILEAAGIDADCLQSALAAAGHHVHLSTVSRYIAPDDPESAKEPPAWMVGIARQLAASIGTGQVAVAVSRDGSSGQSRGLTMLVPAELFNQFEQARVAEGVKSRSTFALKLLEAGYHRYARLVEEPEAGL